MGLGQLRILAQRLFNQHHRLLRITDLLGNHAQQVQCIHMIGLLIQNLPIELFRFDQFTHLVVLQGALDGGSHIHQHT